MSDRIGVAPRAELDAFLERNPDVQSVQIMITDPSGVLRGKAVQRSELARIFESGRQVAGSILGLDITGQDVDDTGLVWETGDADMTARPVAGTLVRAPWLAAPTGLSVIDPTTNVATVVDRDRGASISAAGDGLWRSAFVAAV